MPKQKTENTDTAENRALNLAMSAIEKAYGKGSIMLGTTAGPFVDHPAIPTGSLGLDIALGIGGMPRGRIIEVTGPESAGKTTLALQIIAQAQAMGGMAAFIDAEHAIDRKYAGSLGVQMSQLLISQPDTGEQALSICDTLVRSHTMDVIVIDSVSALVPKAELEGDMGDSHVGLQARLMSQALRKLTALCAKTDTMIIFINQIRMKIGVMFGNPETGSGGNALKFYSSVRLDTRRVGAVKKGDEILGNRTRVRVIKNKMAPPGRQCEFDLIYGEGIDLYGEILDLGLQESIIKKSGAWYSVGEERLGHGRLHAIQTIKSMPDLIATIAGDHYANQIVIKEEENDDGLGQALSGGDLLLTDDSTLFDAEEIQERSANDDSSSPLPFEEE